ncbi:DUF262 domain-containing protein [Akkermansia sp.]|uniref:DUF262 domain-containing protein n=1 Tax=Akkermansia sp. TaxID=1872421 RepID=UPI003AB50B11
MEESLINLEVQDDDVLERENIGEDNDVERAPFDPTRIDIITKQDTLINIIERLKYNEINLSPDYQRHPDLWTPLQQSRLVESILIRIPLPALYFDCSKENCWEIVDGLQRLSAIKNFVIDKTLSLSGLEYLSHLKGKRYDDLERQYIRRINECPITYFQITPGTPEEVKYSIFRRINTGGLVLNEQEIRNAMATSQARIFLQNMVNNQNFNMIFSDSKNMKKRMKDQELALRFLAFYHMDVQKISFTNIAELLNSMMTILNNSSAEERKQWGEAYDRALMRSYALFGERAFEKSYVQRVRKNTPLYEVWTVCLAHLSEAQWQRIQPYHEEIRQEHQRRLEPSDEYTWAISNATQKREHIALRYNTVKQILQKYDPEHQSLEF